MSEEIKQSNSNRIFDESPLKELFDYEKRGGKVLFWTCPKGCSGQVEWKSVGENHVATCKVCGETSTTPPPPDSSIAASMGATSESFYYDLFGFFSKNHNLTLLDSEIADIVDAVTSSRAFKESKATSTDELMKLRDLLIADLDDLFNESAPYTEFDALVDSYFEKITAPLRREVEELRKEKRWNESALKNYRERGHQFDAQLAAENKDLLAQLTAANAEIEKLRNFARDCVGHYMALDHGEPLENLLNHIRDNGGKAMNQSALHPTQQPSK